MVYKLPDFNPPEIDQQRIITRFAEVLEERMAAGVIFEQAISILNSYLDTAGIDISIMCDNKWAGGWHVYENHQHKTFSSFASAFEYILERIYRAAPVEKEK